MSWKYLSQILSSWIFLSFVVGIPLIAWIKKVNIFESFIHGAKDGIQISIKIIPPLVAILIALGMFRAAGGFILLSHALQPLLHHIGCPAAVVPLALIRPFSGSASNGMLAELAKQYGGHSYIAHLAATMVGSTETTFYIVAVYFGIVAIRRTRYAIVCGLLADFTGIVAAIIVTNLIWQH
ncbi:MAG: spore maturation protein [Gammaproteobacteria bacterium]|nr:spore maturation protein [Gammaproteobacteria bacterium]